MNKTLPLELMQANIIFYLIATILMVGCSEKKGEYFNYVSNGFNEKISIEYTISEFQKGSNSYIDRQRTSTIDPKKSALVIIDLWRLNYLDTVVTSFINPLIKEVDSLGMKVIYAPSQGVQNKNLTVLNHGTHFYQMDIMDKYILDNNIENLIYIGFDTLYCVLDKPNGIYSYLSRNENNKSVFVLESGLMSYTKEMKATALSLLKKNNVGVIHTDGFNLNASYPQQTKSDLFAETKPKLPSGKDFIIFFKNDRTENDLTNFEKQLNGSKSAEYAEVRDNTLYYKDRAISLYGLLQLFEELKIRNLYYAGFYLNNEILWSDYGLLTMYIKKRYYDVNIPSLFFINDLCYIIPDDTISPEAEKYTIINHYRGVHNVESDILIEGLSEKQSKSKNNLAL